MIRSIIEIVVMTMIVFVGLFGLIFLLVIGITHMTGVW